MKVSDKPYTSICRYLSNRNIYLDDAECELVRSITTHRFIPKHTVVMEQGKPVEKLFFLNAGIVRLYRLQKDNDYTLGLISSNDFISTPLYLANGVPSTCALETLTDIEVLEWGKPEMELLKRELHKGHELEMAIMERLLSWLQDIRIDAICLSAEERYLKLLQGQPEVMRDIPLKYIASFLCIHQDSLSRIRKMVRAKG